jgi:hypothetical protein
VAPDIPIESGQMAKTAPAAGRPRLAFSSCALPFWVDVAGRLVEARGFEVCYWLGGSAIWPLVEERFPGAVLHRGADARDGRLPEVFDDMPTAPLDHDLLTAMAPYEVVVLKMMERLDLCDSFPYPDRVRQYHRILMAMTATLEHVQPDLVVHATQPHVVHDYVLYALCQIRGIPSVMFERSSLPGRIYPLSRIEDGNQTVIDEYQRARAESSAGRVALPADIEDYLAAMQGDYADVMPARLKYKLERAVEKVTLDQGATFASRFGARWSAITRSGRTAASILIGGPSQPAGMVKGRAFEDRRMGRIDFLRYRFAVRRKRRRLMACYQSLCRDVDLTRPYIFVALQCQPEKQSCPNGGVFAHQGLMVDLLSKTIPRDWQLYVKEHVSQFNDYQTPERGREELFYRDMGRLPNVTLVPLSMNAFDLIDGAKAVATISGTAGWEAVVRGRPALLFAHGWYRGCDGVYYTPTAEACRQALAEIEAGGLPDPDLVRLFVSVAERYSVTGFYDPVMKAVTGISPEQNAAVISGAILDHLARAKPVAARATVGSGS